MLKHFTNLDIHVGNKIKHTLWGLSSKSETPSAGCKHGVTANVLSSLQTEANKLATVQSFTGNVFTYLGQDHTVFLKQVSKISSRRKTM